MVRGPNGLRRTYYPRRCRGHRGRAADLKHELILCLFGVLTRFSQWVINYFERRLR